MPSTMIDHMELEPEWVCPLRPNQRVFPFRTLGGVWGVFNTSRYPQSSFAQKCLFTWKKRFAPSAGHDSLVPEEEEEEEEEEEDILVQ